MAALWETLNPPVFLQVANDEPEAEEVNRNERKRHPACEWDVQEENICNLSFEFSWWDGVHGVWRERFKREKSGWRSGSQSCPSGFEFQIKRGVEFIPVILLDWSVKRNFKLHAITIKLDERTITSFESEGGGDVSLGVKGERN